MLAGLTLASCQNDFDDPALAVPEATAKANMTLADFKERFADDNAVLLTDDMLTPDGSDRGEQIVIKGRVISSDASGNIYQSLVIQDGTSALPVTVRRAGLYADYHLGQEVVISTAGLWMGKYNGLQQLGWLGEPYNGTPQLTFMSYAEFSTHTELNGLPQPETSYILPDAERPEEGIYCLIERIDQLPTSGPEMRALQGQLVEFRNVSWDGGGELDYAPYQENANRYIKHEDGQLKLTVRNSGYSTFYNDILPAGVGTVRGILSWYGDGSSSTAGVVGGWQLLLRSEADVIFDSKGQREDPYTVDEVLGLDESGASGWMKGYIVGSVKGGVTAVSSAADVIFGPNAELDNNLLVAQTADCADYTRCVAVQLPQGTDLRKYGNLVDNPAVCGKSILIRGDFGTYLGMRGLTGNSGQADQFEIDGVKIEGGDTPDKPSGTETTLYEGLASANDFTFEDVTLPSAAKYIWMWDSQYKCLKASAFIGGKSYASESWAVSPEISLAGATDIQISLQQVNNKWPDLAFAKESVSLCVREKGGEWESIPMNNIGDNNSWTFVDDKVSVPSKFNGKTVQVGLKYTSADGKSGTWEVKNLKVTGKK